jgi:hypothetical protein
MRRSSFVVVAAAFLLSGAVVAGPAVAATSVRARHGNGSIATAQAIALAPTLELRQKRPNDTLATAQPVSPTHYDVDALGTLTKRQPSAFFAFALAAGDVLHVSVGAKDPTRGFPELLLYDANGNLVAIANGNGSNGSDSVVDFVIPGGAGGAWTAQVTGSPSAPSAKAMLFRYDLRVRTNGMPYRTDVKGRLAANNAPGFYAIAANVGDHLHLVVAAKDPTRGFPELLLYDESGNLVAIANGNGANGSDSVIDFTIPGGAGGKWTAEVTGSPSVDAKKNHFAYDLAITGATGIGPVVPK